MPQMVGKGPTTTRQRRDNARRTPGRCAFAGPNLGRMPAADYTEVFRDDATVDRYESETYAPGSYDSVINDRERAWLRPFAAEAFSQPPVQLDFACGTGRALRMLDGVVAEALGYDTSEAMLSRARIQGVNARLHVISESGPLPDLAELPPGPRLVTVFRLVLNAPPQVRERALAFAAEALPSAGAGLLVVENHGSAPSLRQLRRVLLPVDKRRWFSELRQAELLDVLDRHGFELVTRQAFSVLTQGFYHPGLRGALAPAVDTWLSRRSSLARWATNVLYVARRR